MDAPVGVDGPGRTAPLSGRPDHNAALQNHHLRTCRHRAQPPPKLGTPNPAPPHAPTPGPLLTTARHPGRGGQYTSGHEPAESANQTGASSCADLRLNPRRRSAHQPHHRHACQLTVRSTPKRGTPKPALPHVPTSGPIRAEKRHTRTHHRRACRFVVRSSPGGGTSEPAIPYVPKYGLIRAGIWLVGRALESRAQAANGSGRFRTDSAREPIRRTSSGVSPSGSATVTAPADLAASIAAS